MPLVIILVVAVGLANFFYLLPPVINWDEGTHALWGFKEWLALRSGDFPLFWELSRAQFAYPPLGSWLIALVNLPFEFSMNLARLVSTLGFIMGGILLFLIGSSLSVKQVLSTNTLVATRKLILKISQYPNILISLFLYLTSPAILFYSVTVFKESWGMALTLLTFYLYFRAVEKKSIKYYFLTGLFLVLLFWEKYNYAVLLGLVLGLEAVVEAVLLSAGPVENSIRSLRAPKGRGNLIKREDCFVVPLSGTPRNDKKYSRFLISQLALFLPMVLFGYWWILTPLSGVLTPTNKLSWFLDIMRSDWNPVTVGVGNSWQYLTFFVQSIRVSYVFSDVLFWGLVVGYVGAMRDLWRKKIRVLWLFFTINFILGTLHSINLQDRYILTSVPALFLLAGYEFSALSSRANEVSVAIYSWLRLPRRPSISLGTPRNDKNRESHLTIQQFNNIFIGLLVLLVFLDFLKFPRLLKSNATHMLLSPMYNESDYKDTLFDFNKSHWSYKITQNKNESPEGVIDYILDNVDINKPIEIIGATAEISPDWWELRRQMALRKNGEDKRNGGGKGKYLVTIEVKPTSRLYTYDYSRANSWQLAKVKEINQTYMDKLIQEKDFKELGVVVRIYSL